MSRKSVDNFRYANSDEPYGVSTHEFDYETGMFLPRGRNRRSGHVPPPPPKPVRPVGTELLQSYATTHRAREVSHSVKFQTREDLMLGLDYIAGRNMSGALGHTLSAVGDNDSTGMAVPLMMMAMPNKHDWYDINIRNPIEQFDINDAYFDDPRSPAIYRDSWDYDGPGPWHKASLIVWADRDGFYLHHHAAYVGNRAEVRMAAALGDRAILNVTRFEHRLTYETHDNRWSIPLADLRIIYNSAGEEFDADAFLQTLLNPTNPEERTGKWADITGPVTITPSGGVKFTIALGYNTLWASQHDRDSKTNQPLPHHAYRIEDDCLTGPARDREDQFAEDWRRPIDLIVTVSPDTAYDTTSISSARIASNVLATGLQTRESRPDPYPNE